MDPILLAVLLVAGIGVAAGLLLGIASKVFAVPENEKAAAVEELLPGANCGGCGFSGCSGYAEALADGKETDTAKCVAGNADLPEQLAQLLGLAATAAEKKVAVVLCQGNAAKAEIKMEYRGEHSCRAANKLYGGPKSCPYGCIGFGDCVEACPFHAVSLCSGVAVIDPNQCRACGKCVTACPKGIIDLLPAQKAAAIVKCKNTDKGNLAMKVCKVSCIGCKKCEKTCPSNAIHVTDNLARVDRHACTACGACVENCPKGCITIG